MKISNKKSNFLIRSKVSEKRSSRLSTVKPSVKENVEFPRRGENSFTKNSFNDSNVEKRTPGIVFNKSFRLMANKEILPGPADYKTAVSSKGISHRFSRTPKGSYMRNLNTSPGPGHYHFNTSTNRGRSAILTGRRQNKYLMKNPGPGSYDPRKILPGNPNWSIPRSKKINRSPHGTLPSPLSYNPRDALTKTGSCPFGKARRFFYKRERTPGPGTYTPSKY